MSHIPTFDNRGRNSRPKPYALGAGQLLTVYGVLHFLLVLLDFFGRGESALDIYIKLPIFLKFLGSPWFSGLAIIAGFALLWSQGRSFQKIPKSVLIHPRTFEPISAGMRMKPALRRAGWAVVAALILTIPIGVIYRTPVNNYVFVHDLPVIPLSPPEPPQQEERPTPSQPITPPSVHRPVPITSPIPAQQSAPTQAPYNPPVTQPATQPLQSPSGELQPSAYEEVQFAIDIVQKFAPQWEQGLRGCNASREETTRRFTDATTQSDKDDERVGYGLCLRDFENKFQKDWNGQSAPVGPAINDAIARMRMPGAKQITPNEASQLGRTCNGALSTAGTNTSFT